MKKEKLSDFLKNLNVEINEQNLDMLFDFTNKEFNSLLNVKIKNAKEETEKETSSQILKNLGFESLEAVNQKLILADENEKLKNELENTNLLFQLSKMGVDENLGKLVLEGVKKETKLIEDFETKLAKINELVSPILAKTKIETEAKKIEEPIVKIETDKIEFLKKTQSIDPIEKTIENEATTQLKNLILK